MIVLSEIFKEKELLQTVSSHKKAIDLALEKAKRIGQGSSRAVFDLKDPEYGETVIKIAKNKKGLYQNEFETEVLGDNFYPDILPKLYDYDKDSIMQGKNEGKPLWLQVEKVSKITLKEYDKALDNKSSYLKYYLYSILGPNYNFGKNLLTSEIKEYFSNNEYVQELLQLAGNYGLPIEDLTTYRNIGKRDNGDLVVLDVGLSQQIYDNFYRRK